MESMSLECPIGIKNLHINAYEAWEGHASVLFSILNSVKPVPLDGIDVLMLVRGSGYESNFPIIFLRFESCQQ